MAAAVADFSPKSYYEKKIEKQNLQNIILTPTPDIIKTVSSLQKKPIIIGFSADTGLDFVKIKKKFLNKKMDIIVFNDVTVKGAGFETDTNKITIIEKKGIKDLPLMSKEECAEEIIHCLMNYLITN